jgi:type I restriction enzyme M protein
MSNIGGIIKSIRDIFRKDPGLNGDAQRIEQLGWMIFLKLFDDKDQEKELMDPKYKSPIPSTFQWRNWAADDEGNISKSLIFIRCRNLVLTNVLQTADLQLQS